WSSGRDGGSVLRIWRRRGPHRIGPRGIGAWGIGAWGIGARGGLAGLAGVPPGELECERFLLTAPHVLERRQMGEEHFAGRMDLRRRPQPDLLRLAAQRLTC